ncbi:hypothetical protein PSTG_11300 [Puccinia striiformis f. sp. tritici PST-78]|uniref:Uncharacterized protein n=1 Tax=Puccinia striiformis f. sp. tritici PST-78 TaxID=1165861 RepID=A0A0L0V8B5_9BASI|nr:hypothetical protein PSTG_11300 [Puccinia striiformis f. sp. tritici PST-78]
MGETDSSQPKENQVPPLINVRPDAPRKYHQVTHHLHPKNCPASPHNHFSDSNLSYNLNYCNSSHLVFLHFTSHPSETLLNLEPANHLDTLLTTYLTLQTHPSINSPSGTPNSSCVKKNRASQKPKKTASRKRSRLTTEDDEEEEEEINHCEGRPNEEIEEEENLYTNFSLENFKSQLPFWSIQKLRDVLAKRKKACSNRVPPNVQEALVLLQQNYIKSKLLLSLLGRISENTTAKFLGKNKPSWKKSNWNRFIAFSVTSEQTPVPLKGCSEGWEERNVILGEAWDNLSEVEKEVFGPKILQFFSKIPRYFGYLEEEDDGDKTVKLTQEEDEFY